MDSTSILELYKDVCILHLSDLHITFKNGRSYDASLDHLINDIALQLKDIEKVILVISGDLIDKGEYNDKTRKSALDFFEALYKELNGKIVDLVIVPGNHDKQRNNINTLVSMGAQLSDEKIGDEEWNFQLNAYKGFLDLYNDLLKLFHPEGKKKINNTFGVHYFETNGQVVIFVRIDSAWSSCSSNDSGKLRIGNYQSKMIVEQYQLCYNSLRKKYKEKEILTVAISHYPINLLDPAEEELCNNLFLTEENLNVDILLCGHIHDSSLAHYFNHEHSLLTLVTGIGGTENSLDSRVKLKADHRYSIYSLNLKNNSCDIIMRKSSGKNYSYDYSIYTGTTPVPEEKITYPIRVRESHPFIKMFAPEVKRTKSMFLDSLLLSNLAKVSKSLFSFIHQVTNTISVYKIKAYDEVRCELQEKFSKGEINIEESESVESEVYDYYFHATEFSDIRQVHLNCDSAIIYFGAFLLEICSWLIKCIQNCFSENTIIRAHFMVYNLKEDNFISLGSETKERYTNSSPNKIPWTRIMQAAFDNKQIIQLSANPDLNDIITSQDDFLTVIPDFIGNETEKISKGTEIIGEKRPCITFGLSIKNSQLADSEVLSILAFLGLDNALKTLINDFIDVFKINLSNSLFKLINLVGE